MGPTPEGRGEGNRLRRFARALRRFWDLGWEANVTGQSAMVAYTMMLATVPLALLALFVAGEIISSKSIENRVLLDLQQIFPGTHARTLHRLLHEVRTSTTKTGVIGFIGSIWLGSSVWSALDTAFTRIYRSPPRKWLEQKRFALGMLLVVLLFMVATVAVPVVQSLIKAGTAALPFDLARVPAFAYAVSLTVGIALLFLCLLVIYKRVPNRAVPWRAVWPGALAAAIAISILDYVFPAYLTNVSTLARFGTTIVFILIVLVWFYLLAMIILGGGIINALRLTPRDAEATQQFDAAPREAAVTQPLDAV